MGGSVTLGRVIGTDGETSTVVSQVNVVDAQGEMEGLR